MASHTVKIIAPVPSKPHVSAVSCSVCFETVFEDAGDRSIAKLKCGHFFHLDCIGSAFNAKGRMQCPNCRHVEQGQWLYASGCFLPEDFVEDLTIDDDVAYIGATNLQFSHTPWCPHQGSYYSFAFEASDNPSHSYIDPVVNMRVGSQVSAVGAPICPYLATHGLSLGVPSPQMEGLHVGHHHPSRFSRRRVGDFYSTSQRNFGSHQTSATSFSSMPVPYEGTSRSIGTGIFARSNSNPQNSGGFLVPSTQSPQAGVNQVSNRSNGAPTFSQLSIHVRSAQPMNTAPNNSYMGNGWTGQNEMNVTSLRNHQVPSTTGGWTNEPVHSFTPIVGSAQMSNPIGPNGIYTAQPSSSQWWGWVPHANQRIIANGVPNAYQGERQNFNAGLFPRLRPHSNNRIY